MIQSIFFLYIIKNTIYIILTVFLILSCLIYLEILVLNFCGLSENIRENIEKRGIESLNDDLNQTDSTISMSEYMI